MLKCKFLVPNHSNSEFWYDRPVDLVQSLSYTHEEKIETVYTAWEHRARASDTVRGLRVAQQEVLGEQQKTRKAICLTVSKARQQSTYQGSGSPSLDPDQQHQHYPGTCQKSKFVDLTSELLNQKFWKWDPAIWFNKSLSWFCCTSIFENLTTENNQVTIFVAFGKV